MKEDLLPTEHTDDTEGKPGGGSETDFCTTKHTKNTKRIPGGGSSGGNFALGSSSWGRGAARCVECLTLRAEGGAAPSIPKQRRWRIEEQTKERGAQPQRTSEDYAECAETDPSFTARRSRNQSHEQKYFDRG